MIRTAPSDDQCFVQVRCSASCESSGPLKSITQLIRLSHFASTQIHDLYLWLLYSRTCGSRSSYVELRVSTCTDLLAGHCCHSLHRPRLLFLLGGEVVEYLLQRDLGQRVRGDVKLRLMFFKPTERGTDLGARRQLVSEASWLSEENPREGVVQLGLSEKSSLQH